MNIPLIIKKYRFIRFVLVGIVNTIFGLSMYTLCLYVGMPYQVATFVSTVLGVLFNFKSTGVIVFGSHDNHLIWRFVLFYAVVYVIQIFIIKILLLTTLLNNYWCGYASTPFVAIFSFLMQKKFVFKKVLS